VTGLPYRHLSLICAMSTGENYEPHQVAHMGGEER
jgi:hypothetical protein